VIDAYRIESAPPRLQALMSSTYIAGYRIGMVASGAGALVLASAFGSELGSYSYTRLEHDLSDHGGRDAGRGAHHARHPRA
jgi:hypothetical protein